MKKAPDAFSTIPEAIEDIRDALTIASHNAATSGQCPRARWQSAMIGR